MKAINRKIKSIFRRLYNAIALPTISEVLEENNDIILQKTARLINIALLHQQTFGDFKGCNIGKDVVLIGAGPTVNKFKPIENCLYVGLNRACMLSNVKFDYLFTIDKLGIEQYYKEFGEYDCVKFVGDQNLGPNWQIPETEIRKMKNVRQYKTDAGLFSHSCFTLDIDREPLGNFNTVSLQAMQFILYTQPRRIYLVGIDCSTAGHFHKRDKTDGDLSDKMSNRGEDLKLNMDYSIIFWSQLKEFADQYYPDIEIISVNPVGLRGMFKDLDQ